MTVELEARDLQWVKGEGDDPTDHCAHGRVKFRVNETTFVEPADNVWTLSASALYLLRTLEDSHVHPDDVTQGNQLFPCCGFNVWPTNEGKYRLFCLGCPNGIDIYVTLQNNQVTIQSLDGKSETIAFREWMDAVFGFADRVLAFYNTSSPKIEHEDELDRNGWIEFWKEWDMRRNKSYSEISSKQ